MHKVEQPIGTPQKQANFAMLEALGMIMGDVPIQHKFLGQTERK